MNAPTRLVDSLRTTPRSRGRRRSTVARRREPPIDDHGDDDPAATLLFGVLRGLGMEPDPRPAGGGTDGNVFRGHGIASVVIGRGGYNQHTKEEYLVIPEMLECARVVEACVRTVG